MKPRETSDDLVAVAQRYRDHDDPQVRRMAMSLISQAQDSQAAPGPNFGRAVHLDAIPEGMPVMLLLGSDACAWETAVDYADRAQRMGADPALVESARRHADAMRRWPTKKLPDLGA